VTCYRNLLSSEETALNSCATAEVKGLTGDIRAKAWYCESVSGTKKYEGGGRGGPESVIREFLNLIAVAQVFHDATDRFTYPLGRSELAGTAGKR
jgi:hypothetical protein